ncbi:binding partner of ACD11 1-like [Zingiber officinale]|uniref:binding partner of ACD11 1-like n=1 Tax=Zingiber officinale TaxID=94328 RepID=UPI001C4B672C|nr:binding partner of ACD11 1-like [Zingiber officinale]
MQTRTIRVANISYLVKEREIREFFSFSGDIERIEIRGEGGIRRVAFVTFKDSKALEIALLLSGATIVDQIVTITPAEDYVPRIDEQVKENDVTIDIPVEIYASTHDVSANSSGGSSSRNGRVYVTKAQGAVAAVFAKGSAIRQDAINRAKAFDEKHRLMATASEKVVSFDKRVGFTEKLTVGISVVNEKVKSAEQRLNDTGSAVKTNRYITAGTAWLQGAFDKVAVAGHVATAKTREKFQLAMTNMTSKDRVVAV